MIGVDATFLVQLEVVDRPAQKSAHELLQREILSPQVPLALAPQVLAEFIHVVTDPRRFSATADFGLSDLEGPFLVGGCRSSARRSNQRVHRLVPRLDAAPLAWPQTHPRHPVGGSPLVSGCSHGAHVESSRLSVIRVSAPRAVVMADAGSL